MKHLLTVSIILAFLVACTPGPVSLVPPHDPTDPCWGGIQCPDKKCCPSEDYDCGGTRLGCPLTMCCYIGPQWPEALRDGGAAKGDVPKTEPRR